MQQSTKNKEAVIKHLERLIKRLQSDKHGSAVNLDVNASGGELKTMRLEFWHGPDYVVSDGYTPLITEVKMTMVEFCDSDEVARLHLDKHLGDQDLT